MEKERAREQNLHLLQEKDPKSQAKVAHLLHHLRRPMVLLLTLKELLSVVFEGCLTERASLKGRML